MKPWIICCKKEDKKGETEIKDKKSNPIETEEERKALYCLGWIFIICASTAVLLFSVLGIPKRVWVPPCLFRMLTGYYCPGCGGTRAVRALLQGAILASVCYHPFVLYGTVLFVWFMFSNTVEYGSRGKFAVGMRYKNSYVIIGAVLILINFVLQNGIIFFNRHL